MYVDVACPACGTRMPIPLWMLHAGRNLKCAGCKISRGEDVEMSPVVPPSEKPRPDS